MLFFSLWNGPLNQDYLLSTHIILTQKRRSNIFPDVINMRKIGAVSDEILIATYNSRNRTVSNEHLTEIFEHIGRRFGYDEVSARFSPFADFKVKWQRSYKWIEFEVSDYLDRAPDNVIADLAESIFTRISGKESDYSEAVIRYLNDPVPRADNCRDFIERKREISNTSIGEFHDLNDCVNRLRDAGLIPYDLECVLCWQQRPSGRKPSGCSVIQRVAWVSSELDRKGVPENVLDYAVYNALTYFIIGFGQRDIMEHEHDRMDALYPMREEALSWLHRNGFYI